MSHASDSRCGAQDHGGYCRITGTESGQWPIAQRSAGICRLDLNSLLEATKKFVIPDPTNAKAHRKVEFDALWGVRACFFLARNDDCLDKYLKYNNAVWKIVRSAFARVSSV